MPFLAIDGHNMKIDNNTFDTMGKFNVLSKQTQTAVHLSTLRNKHLKPRVSQCTESLPEEPHQEASADAPFHSRLGSVLSQSVDWPLSQLMLACA